jgi:hypothetical protein
MSDPERPSYTLTFAEESTSLHATVTGKHSEEAVRGRLGTLQVFKIAADGSEQARGHLKAIACVDALASDGLIKFAEDVALNRGLRVAVFRTASEAKRWLTTQ